MKSYLLAAAGLVLLASALTKGDEPVPIPMDTLQANLDISKIPVGLDRERPVPKDNPLTTEKVSLGRKLFFDPILSGDNTVSCASCHQPAHGFAAPEKLARGFKNRTGTRNAPSLLNRAYGKAFFWDGRENSLEAQALHPIASAQEMGSSVADAVARLQSHSQYPGQFKMAFADGVTSENLARALASFERVLLSGNTRVDRFRAGEVASLTDSETHGFWLYESRGRCWRCHTGPNFTDEGFHNSGVGSGMTSADTGRYQVTKLESDRGRFKTPTLRGLAMTGPYMHDGGMATLEEVVEFYSQGGKKNANLDPILEPLNLSKSDMLDLVAFLKALSENSARPSTLK